MTRCGTALLIALSAGACTPPAPPVLPLQPDDFTLAGVPLDADSAEIRLTFGEPDSIVAADNPFASAVPLTTWVYDGFEVRFAGDAVPAGYMIRSAGEGTARGVRVGAPSESVRRLYGEPDARYSPAWTYVGAVSDSVLRVIDLVIEADTVRRIYIGRALD